MYDVVYVDSATGWQVIASGLQREPAAQLARDEAKRRKACRMFLTGSPVTPRTNAVLVIEARA